MTVHFVNLLDELQRRSLRMASMVEDMLQEACDAVSQTDETLARRVVTRDRDVDSEEVKVESEVIRLLALYQPVGSDLRLLCTVLKVNNDLERIADCAVNMAERARHLDPGFSSDNTDNLTLLGNNVKLVLRHAVEAYASKNAEAARAILTEDEAVDALYGQIIRKVIVEASARPDTIASHLDMLSVAKNLERVADHATNIAEDVIFLSTGRIVRHQKDL